VTKIGGGGAWRFFLQNVWQKKNSKAAGKAYKKLRGEAREKVATGGGLMTIEHQAAPLSPTERKKANTARWSNTKLEKRRKSAATRELFQVPLAQESRQDEEAAKPARERRLRKKTFKSELIKRRDACNKEGGHLDKMLDALPFLRKFDVVATGPTSLRWIPGAKEGSWVSKETCRLLGKAWDAVPTNPHEDAQGQAQETLGGDDEGAEEVDEEAGIGPWRFVDSSAQPAEASEPAEAQPGSPASSGAGVAGDPGPEPAGASTGREAKKFRHYSTPRARSMGVSNHLS